MIDDEDNRVFVDGGVRESAIEGDTMIWSIWFKWGVRRIGEKES